MAKPDLILCPFLTKRVPKEVYGKVSEVNIKESEGCASGKSRRWDAVKWKRTGDVAKAIATMSFLIILLFHGYINSPNG